MKCALPAGHSLSKYDAEGDMQVLEGAIGLAPEWENGSCGSDCQEWVTACMLAHVNLTGQHVAIWLTAEHAAIDWSLSEEFPNQEAGYFGNLFQSRPAAYVCYGDQVQTNPIPGRVCVGNAECPYTDPYLPSGGYCHRVCDAHESDGTVDGYQDCSVGSQSFSHVITTWKP